jgi:hypothetical protein
MTSQPITAAEFAAQLRDFERAAFRLETRRYYALDYERHDFELFVAGRPRPPEQLEWWRPWLEQIARLTAEGKTISRVRIVDDPPTDYQRWEMWATDTHAAAGERIAYLDRAAAISKGLPMEYDWWLLDEARLLIIRHNTAGEVVSRTLNTDPGDVARHCAWRDLAVSHAHPAGHVTAA